MDTTSGYVCELEFSEWSDALDAWTCLYLAGYKRGTVNWITNYYVRVLHLTYHEAHELADRAIAEYTGDKVTTLVAFRP